MKPQNHRNEVHGIIESEDPLFKDEETEAQRREGRPHRDSRGVPGLQPSVLDSLIQDIFYNIGGF